MWERSLLVAGSIQESQRDEIFVEISQAHKPSAIGTVYSVPTELTHFINATFYKCYAPMELEF